MITTPLKDKPLGSGFSDFIYDEESRFGVKVSVREAYEVREHSHNNIQISIPISETSVEITWQRSNGCWSGALAHRGDAIIVPFQQPHSVTWRKSAQFVNLHIGMDEQFADAKRFLNAVVRAGEMHVVRDSFLYSFGENIISLISRGVTFDPAFLKALRVIIVEHIINHYASSQTEKYDDRANNLPSVVVSSAFPSARADAEDEIQDEIQKDKPNKSSISGLAPWQIRKVLAFVCSDLKRDRSVDELADLVGLSKGHFSRAFLASTGLSPHQWIIRERINLAKSKLAHTEETISEIASSCGFTEQSHFTRTFTKAEGISPAAWRRQNKV
ncbi:helix-turn-helix domain-containing protein [Dongia soli]|uniref:AraC family transcriptional regulator n=1 Tax=Dongia soli TaxID=600628 RepID=A0ABU5E672_9PROT|nr:AraC family transcriptional regulator [Dongia soli]MDY0881539.1 AraC family transcriptional regulator [Dongia soli]